MSVILGTDVLCDPSFTELTDNEVHMVMITLIVISIGMLLLVNFLNRLYDHVSGYDGKKRKVGRWARTLLFVGLLTILCWLIVIITALGIGDMNETSTVVELIFITCAIVVSIWLYSANYRKTKDAGARIHDLIYEQVMNKNRRYTLLINKDIPMDKNGCTINGKIYGEIHVGDQVVVLHPNVKEIYCKVTSLQISSGEVKSVKDSDVRINLSCAQVSNILSFSVLTDIQTFVSTVGDSVNVCENPYIVGMIMEYAQHYRESGYYPLLVYSICHGHFLVVGNAQGNTVTGDIMDTLPSKTDVGFPSVSPVNEKREIFPIFTDWDALSRWKDMIRGDRSVSIVVSFQQILPIINNHFAGIVVNPFGPKPFAMSNDLIQSITTSEGYRKDFNS